MSSIAHVQLISATVPNREDGCLVGAEARPADLSKRICVIGFLSVRTAVAPKTRRLHLGTITEHHVL